MISLDYSKVAAYFEPMKVYSYVAIAFVAITITLTYYWVQNNPNTNAYNSSGYLGVPDWNTNIFAYHVALTVGGFLCSQILGAISWVFFENKLIGRVVHIIFESAALISMSIGLVAVVTDQNNNDSYHLTSMHTWFGVFCVAMYSLNYIMGSVLGTVQSVWPDLSVKTLVKIRAVHSFLGQSAMFLTVLAIVTGIMEENGQSGCYYVNVVLTANDANPAQHYANIPDACKLSNGLAIVVIIAVGAAFLAMFYRRKPSMKATKTFTSDDTLYTLAEVSTHNSKDSAWIVVQGHVYDATNFLSSHPGGANMILSRAGSDVSLEFESIHSLDAWTALSQLCIGRILRDNYDCASKIPETVASGCLDHEKYTSFKLIKRTQLSADSVILRFELPLPTSTLGLPAGNHVLVRAVIDGQAQPVVRKYTPISTASTQGYFELLVKIYRAGVNPAYPRGGLMSQHLGSLSEGSSVEFKGPIGHVFYPSPAQLEVSGTRYDASYFALIAAGSGITPIYQMIRTVLDNPLDPVVMCLLYANRTESDILLADDLCALAAQHPTRFSVLFTLSQPRDPSRWAGLKGRVDETMISNVFPRPSAHVALLCGPREFTHTTVPAALKATGFNEARIVAF